MVNLPQQRKRKKTKNELMSMLLFLLSLYMITLLCDLLQFVSVRDHEEDDNNSV